MSGTWKAIERRIATYFGTVRNPLSGSNGKHSGSDSLHPSLYIEVKYRERHSAVSLWRDTALRAKLEGKTPVVCLAEKNKTGYWLVVHSDHLTKISDIRKKVLKTEEEEAHVVAE